MPVKTYVSIPTDIDALQWDGTEERARELIEFTSGQEGFRHRDAFYVLEGAQRIGRTYTARLWVMANTDWLSLETGEWVARDSAGFYPIKADVFARKYREKFI
jgi:hypothetical protein